MDFAFLAVGASLILMKVAKDALNMLADYYVQHREARPSGEPEKSATPLPHSSVGYRDAKF